MSETKWTDLTCAGCPAFSPIKDKAKDRGLCLAVFPRCNAEGAHDWRHVYADDWCLPGRRMMASGQTFDPATPISTSLYNDFWAVWDDAKRG